jgi:DNA replication initiation complex subunit (GINS family)
VRGALSLCEQAQTTTRSATKRNRLCGHKLIKIFALHRYKLICLAEREARGRASEKITPEGREIYGFVTHLIAELFASKA